MIIHSRRFIVNKFNNIDEKHSAVLEAQFKLFCKKCAIQDSSKVDNVKSFDMKAFTTLLNEYKNLKTKYKRVACDTAANN